MRAAQLWPIFEELKRAVVAQNELQAQAVGSEPFALWDFSSPGEITSEAVPVPGDRASRMQYFFDGTHPTPLTGTLVLDRVLGITSDSQFGRRLDSQNLEAVLESDRAAMLRWAAQNQGDVREIAALATKIPK